MTELTNPVTGHRVSTDDESVEFWQVAGYVPEKSKTATKKAAAKKSSSSK